MSCSVKFGFPLFHWSIHFPMFSNVFVHIVPIFHSLSMFPIFHYSFSNFCVIPIFQFLLNPFIFQTVPQSWLHPSGSFSPSQARLANGSAGSGSCGGRSPRCVLLFLGDPPKMLGCRLGFQAKTRKKGTLKHKPTQAQKLGTSSPHVFDKATESAVSADSDFFEHPDDRKCKAVIVC